MFIALQIRKRTILEYKWNMFNSVVNWWLLSNWLKHPPRLRLSSGNILFVPGCYQIKFAWNELQCETKSLLLSVPWMLCSCLGINSLIPFSLKLHRIQLWFFAVAVWLHHRKTCCGHFLMAFSKQTTSLTMDIFWSITLDKISGVSLQGILKPLPHNQLLTSSPQKKPLFLYKAKFPPQHNYKLPPPL